MHAAGTPLLTPVVALALLAGISLALALPGVAPPVVAGVAMAVGVLLAWRVPRQRPVGALLVGFALASLHAAYVLSAQLPPLPVRQEAWVAGRVSDLPRAEPRRTAFVFDVEHGAAQVGGRAIRLSWYGRGDAPPPEIHAGERWRLRVRLRAPRGLRNPGGSDGEMHAFADRIAATGYVLTGERLSAAGGIQGWRDTMSARIGAAVPNAGSRFIRALAIGDTRFLSDEDWTRLRADGLTHLIAISGFHVGMVASVVALGVRLLWWAWPTLGRRLPARIAAGIAGALGAAGYAAASGFSLPTVRTLLMIVVVAITLCLRRGVRTIQILATAAIVVLVADPLSVLTAGFWLSFGGVCWLLWCMPRAGMSRVGELVRAQGVATVGLLPLTVALFGQASLAGPVANLVAVPWWSLVVAPLSVAGVALDAVHPAAGAFAWRLAATCFDIAWPLFERLGSTPLALQYLPEASPVAVVLALGGAAWCLMRAGRRESRSRFSCGFRCCGPIDTRQPRATSR